MILNLSSSVQIVAEVSYMLPSFMNRMFGARVSMPQGRFLFTFKSKSPNNWFTCMLIGR